MGADKKARWSACGGWCDHFSCGRFASWCIKEAESGEIARRVHWGDQCLDWDADQLTLPLDEAVSQ